MFSIWKVVFDWKYGYLIRIAGTVGFVPEP